LDALNHRDRFFRGARVIRPRRGSDEEQNDTEDGDECARHDDPPPTDALRVEVYGRKR
jgi:hypothetical protein